jgi:hypothetical protein
MTAVRMVHSDRSTGTREAILSANKCEGYALFVNRRRRRSPPVVGAAVTGYRGDEASGAGAVGAVFVDLLLR